jgi:uncharacterized metal-binding protein
LGEVALFGTHLLWASETNATFLRVGATCTGTLANQVALELGDPGEDSHDHLAGVGGGVSQGSEMDRKRTPAFPIVSTISSSSTQHVACKE